MLAEENEEQMTHEEAKALLNNVLLIINEGRLDLIEKHFAPDLVLKTTAMPQLGFTLTLPQLPEKPEAKK